MKLPDRLMVFYNYFSTATSRKKFLGCNYSKTNALRIYLISAQFNTTRNLFWSAYSLNNLAVSHIESDPLTSLEKTEATESLKTNPNKRISNEEALSKIIHEINLLKGSDKTERFQFYYLVNSLLRHSESKFFTNDIVCDLIKKSLSFDNIPLSSNIIEWSILRDMQFEQSFALKIVSRFRKTDPFLAYNFFQYCFKSAGFNLNPKDLDYWVVNYVQYLGWDAQYSFYDHISNKYGLEIFSLGVYRIFLKSITMTYSDVKTKARLPASADNIINHALIKYGARNEIVNLILRLQAPLNTSNWIMENIELMNRKGQLLEFESKSLICYVLAFRSNFVLLDELIKTPSSSPITGIFGIIDAILKGLLDSGNTDKAKATFYKHLNDSAPSLLAFSNIIERLTVNDELGEALDLLLKMNHFSIPLTPFIGHCIISGFIKRDDITSAFELLEEMIRLEIIPDISSIEQIIRCSSKLESWNMVFRTYYLALQNRCFSFTPSLIEYISLAQLKTKDLDGFNDTMRELSFFLSSYKAQLFHENDYISLLTFLCSQKKYSELQLVFSHLLKFHHIKSPEVFNIVLKCQIDRKNPEMAFNTYGIMSSLSITPNCETLQTMMLLYFSIGNFKKATELQKDLIKIGFKMDTDTTIKLAKLHLTNGRPKHAIDIYKYNASISSDIDPRLFEIFVQANLKFKRTGYLEEVIRIVKDSHIKPNISTLELIIYDALIIGRNIDKANDALELLRVKGLKENIIIWNYFILYFIKINSINEATRIFNVQLSKLGLDPNITTLSYFICHFASENNLQKTKEWVNIMLELALSPDTDLCNTILEQFTRDIDYDTAFEFYDTMIWCQIPYDNTTVEIMTKFFISFGRYEELISFLESLSRNPRLKPNLQLMDIVLTSVGPQTPSFFFLQLKKCVERFNWPIPEQFKDKIIN